MTSSQSKTTEQLWEDAPQEFRDWLLFHYPINYHQIFDDDIDYEDLTTELRKLLIKKHKRWHKWGKGKPLKRKKTIKKKVNKIGRFTITKITETPPSMIDEWRRLTRMKYRKRTRHKPRRKSKLKKVYTAKRRKRRKPTKKTA